MEHAGNVPTVTENGRKPCYLVKEWYPGCLKPSCMNYFLAQMWQLALWFKGSLAEHLVGSALGWLSVLGVNVITGLHLSTQVVPFSQILQHPQFCPAPLGIPTDCYAEIITWKGPKGPHEIPLMTFTSQCFQLRTMTVSPQLVYLGLHFLLLNYITETKPNTLFRNFCPENSHLWPKLCPTDNRSVLPEI